MSFFIVIYRFLAACNKAEKIQTEFQQRNTTVMQFQKTISQKESENVELKNAIKMEIEKNEKLMKRYETLVIGEQTPFK